MRYFGTVIRPPSEADSYILQVTYGCSHNHCTFCGTYLDKPFQVRPVDDVRQDIALARQFLPETRRVFLADGNALVLSARRLVPVLDALAAAFPSLQRVAAYANARDLLQKSRSELKLLREKGLRIVYLGLESGSDEVLRRINKGATAAEMIEAVQHAQAEDIRVSVIGLLGIGGKRVVRSPCRGHGACGQCDGPPLLVPADADARSRHAPLHAVAPGRISAAGAGGIVERTPPNHSAPGGAFRLHLPDESRFQLPARWPEPCPRTNRVY